ncbi:hypothetical protein VA603_12965 [Stenotrophomonas sp. MH1]|uniref:Uncharacterized protein n=1 Tax=Stenotrophomonas capsici TaxID=3110230 RepID=A0ABU5V6M3_9GAMM|nr:hypothetical protein [Stenotrophomonas sp. MH1]MEA5668453.1 hypothetical protein [Stenotrophomonas sp. MH1]
MMLRRQARERRNAMKQGGPLLVIPALAGCHAEGSPSLAIFGAYFPGWLVLAATAIVLGVLARALVLHALGAGRVPFPLWTFAAIGLIAACLLAWAVGS